MLTALGNEVTLMPRENIQDQRRAGRPDQPRGRATVASGGATSVASAIGILDASFGRSLTGQSRWSPCPKTGESSGGCQRQDADRKRPKSNPSSGRWRSVIGIWRVIRIRIVRVVRIWRHCYTGADENVKASAREEARPKKNVDQRTQDERSPDERSRDADQIRSALPSEISARRPAWRALPTPLPQRRIF
jgi:hypothetical protein